jgi:hypothetical protein
MLLVDQVERRDRPALAPTVGAGAVLVFLTVTGCGLMIAGPDYRINHSECDHPGGLDWSRSPRRVHRRHKHDP